MPQKGRNREEAFTIHAPAEMTKNGRGNAEKEKPGM